MDDQKNNDDTKPEEIQDDPNAPKEPAVEEPKPEETPVEKPNIEEPEKVSEETQADEVPIKTPEVKPEESATQEESAEEEAVTEETSVEEPEKPDHPDAKWYVVHTFAGHENRVSTTLKQRIEAEHLGDQIFDILVPTQDKIEIRAGKKETVKEKIFPGYILVKMILNDTSWLAVRTTQGVTSFVGMGNKPTPISDAEVRTIVKFTTQGPAPTFKDVFIVDDTVKIIDGPFADFIGKVDSVDKEKGRVRILVSIFGRETPVELDFLQVQKL